jgi:hypothetical protein
MMRKIGAFALIIIIIVGLVFTLVSLARHSPVEVTSLPYTFKVKEKVGINLDTDKFHFGGGIPGTSLQRKLNITAPYDTTVHIDSKGPGSVLVNNNDFDLDANENKELLFTLVVPDDLPLGEYEGLIILSFYAR